MFVCRRIQIALLLVVLGSSLYGCRTMTARLGSHEGTPTFLINDKPQLPFIGMTYEPDGERIEPLVAAGIEVYGFNVTADSTPYALNRDVWLEDGSYDYSEVYELLDLYHAQNPQAKFLLRVYTSPPEWWCRANPEELLCDDTGSTMILHSELEPTAPVRYFSAASMASERWLAQSEENITHLIETLEAGPYADSIIAYHIAGGESEEWFNHFTWRVERLGDYSQPMLEAWRRWLRQRYGSDEALQTVWGQPEVSLATVALPDPVRRKDATQTFRDPVHDRDLTDFYLFHQQVNVNAVRRLTAAAKTACDGRKLVGAFFGYFFSFGPQAAESGHQAIADVLALPTVDFIASPTIYGDRRAGHGFADFMSATESVKLHGKLWMNENDIRTFVDRETILKKYPSFKNPERLEWAYRIAGAHEDPAVTVDLLKREVAATLGRGCGKWWFDITGGAYCDPLLIETIRRGQAVAAEAFELDRRSAAQVALVIDDRSVLCQSYRQPLIGAMGQLQLQLGHIGAPFDVILLDDLERAELERYKFLIFGNTYWPGERSKAIRRVLERGDMQALFLYAPGVFTPGRAWEQAPHAMEALTGIKLQLDPTAQWNPVLTMTGTGADQLGIVNAHQTPLLDYEIMPVWCEDPEAEVLGFLADGRAGLVRKGNVFYCATPVPDTTLLRAIARASGVHLYTEQGDVVYATRAFIGVHTGPGTHPRTLTFPSDVALDDLWNDQPLGTGSTFMLPSEPGQSMLMRYDRVK